jgi:hypothetical protein
MHILTRYGTLTAQSLSKAHRKPFRGVACGVLVAIGIALCIEPYAGSSEPVQQTNYIDYKTYSLYLLDFNYQEYNCLLKLYTHESNWNPLSKNGSHYGIPQGKSEWLKDQDGWTQVQWGLDYIGHRYGEPCIALNHWSKYGWH